VGATVCGIETSRRQITYQVLPAKIFIQTDKPIYKPGQKSEKRAAMLSCRIPGSAEVFDDYKDFNSVLQTVY
jgi:hypothetical protein